MRRAPVIAFCLVLVLVACGSDDDTSVDAGDDGARPTVEGDYIAVEATEDGQPRPLVEGTELTLRLEGGRLSASAGCNSMSGPYELEEGVLKVSDLGTTEMGCDEPRHEQDAWVADLLLSEPAVEPVEEGFVLRSGSTAVDFRDHSYVTPDAELVGTTWVVDGFVSGAGPDATVSDAGRLDARVVFGADGTVSGDDGCDGFTIGRNSEELGYVLEGGAIAFEARLVGESSVCPDIDDLVDAFRVVLRGTVTWDIEQDRLTLTGEDGRGVIFRAAQE